MKKEQTGGVKPAGPNGGGTGNPVNQSSAGMTKVPTPDGVKSGDNNDGDVNNTPIGTPMGSVASAGGGPTDR